MEEPILFKKINKHFKGESSKLNNRSSAGLFSASYLDFMRGLSSLEKMGEEEFLETVFVHTLGNRNYLTLLFSSNDGKTNCFVRTSISEEKTGDSEKHGKISEELVSLLKKKFPECEHKIGEIEQALQAGAER